MLLTVSNNDFGNVQTSSKITSVITTLIKNHYQLPVTAFVDFNVRLILMHPQSGTPLQTRAAIGQFVM